jgi:opacity protein-like surface antigen
MTLLSRLLLSSAALAAWPVAQSAAADYDPPIFVEEAPEYVPVEIGSGWYLRGDVSYSFARDHEDTSFRVDNSLFDNDLVGLTGWGNTDLFSYSESENPFSGSIGVGYHFNDFFRAEVNVGRLWMDKYNASGIVFGDDANDTGCLGTQTSSSQTYDFEGNELGAPVVSSGSARSDCLVYGEAKNTTWNGLVNGYVDLGTYAGFTPYIGGGIGAVYSRTKLQVNAQCEASESVVTTGPNTNTTTTFLCAGQSSATDADVTYTPVKYRETEFDLLYALNAGVSYQMTQNVSLDVGYQYLTAPNLTTYAVSLDGIEERKGFDSHQVKVGLRYNLW